MEPNRSLLILSGEDENLVERAEAITDADVFIDFERLTVNQERLERTQKAIQGTSGQCGVRIPGVHTEAGLKAVMAFAELSTPPNFLMLPEIETPAELSVVTELLDARRADIDLFPLLENPKAVFNAYEIASVSERVTAIAFGPVDFQRAMGTPLLAPLDLSLPRYFVAMAGASASVRRYDMPTIGGTEAELRQQTYEARSLGYDGKIAMTDDQVNLINQTFGPSAKEIDKAEQILEAFDVDAGIAEVDGRKYNEEAIEQVRSLLDRADHPR